MKKFTNSFHKVDQSAEDIISLILSDKKDTSFIKVFKKDLSFLPEHNLFELSDAEHMPATSYKAIVSKDLEGVYMQSGQQDQFYRLQNLKDFILNTDTLLDYIRAFFFCVYGAHGQLSLVEGLEDLQWREPPVPSLLGVLKEDLLPLTCHSEDGQSYGVKGCFVSNNALVTAAINVTKNGRISVQDLKIIFENLPVKSNLIDQ